MEYLDSLNAYRKRSRSTEDVGAASKVKQAKVESNGVNVHTNGLPGVNGNTANVFGRAYMNGNGNLSGFRAEVQQDDVMEEGAYVQQSEEPEDDPTVLGGFFLVTISHSSRSLINPLFLS